MNHPQESNPDHLRRSLSNRHLQLIAIGGAIGTGLFMGSGKTISLAGPSVIFAYAIIGSVLFFMMRAMGELLQVAIAQVALQVVIRRAGSGRFVILHGRHDPFVDAKGPS